MEIYPNAFQTMSADYISLPAARNSAGANQAAFVAIEKSEAGGTRSLRRARASSKSRFSHPQLLQQQRAITNPHGDAER